MSNMSYCRFENTLKALQDCYEAIESPEEGDELSKSEEIAKENLLQLCRDIVCATSLIREKNFISL